MSLHFTLLYKLENACLRAGKLAPGAQKWSSSLCLQFTGENSFLQYFGNVLNQEYKPCLCLGEEENRHQGYFKTFTAYSFIRQLYITLAPPLVIHMTYLLPKKSWPKVNFSSSTSLFGEIYNHWHQLIMNQVFINQKKNYGIKKIQIVSSLLPMQCGMMKQERKTSVTSMWTDEGWEWETPPSNWHEPTLPLTLLCEWLSLVLCSLCWCLKLLLWPLISTLTLLNTWGSYDGPGQNVLQQKPASLF